jgi:hypothetical protein
LLHPAVAAGQPQSALPRQSTHVSLMQCPPAAHHCPGRRPRPRRRPPMSHRRWGLWRVHWPDEGCKNKDCGEREQHLPTARASPEAPVCIMHTRFCLAAQWLHGGVGAAPESHSRCHPSPALAPQRQAPANAGPTPLGRQVLCAGQRVGVLIPVPVGDAGPGLAGTEGPGGHSMLAHGDAVRCVWGTFGPQKHKPHHVPTARGRIEAVNSHVATRVWAEGCTFGARVRGSVRVPE